LKVENGSYVAAIPGSDYTVGTAGYKGILQTDLNGNITTAIPGQDYYVPKTSLLASDIKVQSSLEVSGSTTIKSNLNVGGSLFVSNEAEIKNNILIGGTAQAISFDTPSDRRLKKNITPIANPLELLEKINGVRFKWNEEAQGLNSGNDIGVIAQEVEAVLPEAVNDDLYWAFERSYKTVTYDKLIPLLIESIKALRLNQIKLEEKIKQLEEKNG
jgi:hypothetical protein